MSACPSIYADWHTHTHFSHGKDSPEDNVLVAMARGLDEIAITDHGPRQIAHGVRRMDEYLAAIERLKKVYEGRIRVLAGIEANILSPGGETDTEGEHRGRFDVVPAGYHRTALPHSLSVALALQLPALFKMDAAKRNVTLAGVNAIRSGEISFLTHPGEFVAVDIDALADASRETGVPLELNERHPMDSRMIARAFERGATFVLSSDAHRARNVGVVTRAWASFEKSGADAASIVNIKLT